MSADTVTAHRINGYADAYSPPSATDASDAERAVIGSMLLGGVDDERLRPEHFGDQRCRRIFDAIIDMRAEGAAVDALTLRRELLSRGWSPADGWDGFIQETMEAVPHAYHLDTYATQTIDAWRRRQIIETARQASIAAGDPTVDVEEIESRFFDAPSSNEMLTRMAFETLTSAQLDGGQFEQSYLIDGVLVAGQPCIIAAPKKSMKTSKSIDLAISLATSGWFLQHFKSNRCYRVGIMSGESGASTIQETARRICKAKGFTLASVVGLHWCFELPTFGQPADERKLQRFVDDNELDVLIIDPAYLCLPIGDDAGNLFKVGQFLKTFTRISERSGCTPILNHHTRKYNKSRTKGQNHEPPELEDIAWSGFQEWARQWLLINRREPYDASNAGSHKLWLSVGGSAGHSALWGVDIEEDATSDAGGRRWDVTVIAAGDVSAAVANARDDKKQLHSERQAAVDLEKVRTAVAKLPADGETKSEIAALARIPNNRGTPALAELVDEGIIEACNVPKNGRSYPGFRLTRTSRTDSDGVGQSDWMTHSDKPP